MFRFDDFDEDFSNCAYQFVGTKTWIENLTRSEHVEWI